TSGTFSFTSDEAGATFECRSLPGDWAPCASGQSFDGLTGVFQVRARDAAGNVDAPPAQWAWGLDHTAPGLSLTSSGPNYDTIAIRVTLGSFEDATMVFCRLDGGDWYRCAEHDQYVVLYDLAAGPHHFEARATDAAGNTGPVASEDFTIADHAPLVRRAA